MRIFLLLLAALGAHAANERWKRQAASGYEYEYENSYNYEVETVYLPSTFVNKTAEEMGLVWDGQAPKDLQGHFYFYLRGAEGQQYQVPMQNIDAKDYFVRSFPQSRPVILRLFNMWGAADGGGAGGGGGGGGGGRGGGRGGLIAVPVVTGGMSFYGGGGGQYQYGGGGGNYPSKYGGNYGSGYYGGPVTYGKWKGKRGGGGKALGRGGQGWPGEESASAIRRQTPGAKKKIKINEGYKAVNRKNKVKGKKKVKVKKPAPATTTAPEPTTTEGARSEKATDIGLSMNEEPKETTEPPPPPPVPNPVLPPPPPVPRPVPPLQPPPAPSGIMFLPVIEYQQQPPIIQHLIDFGTVSETAIATGTKTIVGEREWRVPPTWNAASGSWSWNSRAQLPPTGGSASFDLSSFSGALSSLGIDQNALKNVQRVTLPDGSIRFVLTQTGGAVSPELLSSLSSRLSQSGKTPALFVGSQGNFVGLGDRSTLSEQALSGLASGQLAGGSYLGGGLRYLGGSTISASPGTTSLQLDSDIAQWLRQFLSTQGIQASTQSQTRLGQPFFISTSELRSGGVSSGLPSFGQTYQYQQTAPRQYYSNGGSSSGGVNFGSLPSNTGSLSFSGESSSWRSRPVVSSEGVQEYRQTGWTYPQAPYPQAPYPQAPYPQASYPQQPPYPPGSSTQARWTYPQKQQTRRR